jgi:hypothetical protein
MPRYSGYNADFYDGPSPFEALVGSFLDTTRSEMDRKRLLKQQAEDRATKAEEDALNQGIKTAELGKEGYGKGPGGQIVRTGLSQENIRYGQEQQEKLSNRNLEAGRRERLSAAVGAALNPNATPEQRNAAIQAAIREDPTQAPSLVSQLTPSAKAPTRGIEVETVNAKGQRVKRIVDPTVIGAEMPAPPPQASQGSWSVRDVPGEAPTRINAATGQVLPFNGLTAREGKPTMRQEMARSALPSAVAANQQYEQLISKGGPISQAEIQQIQNIFHETSGKPLGEVKRYLLAAPISDRARQMGVNAFEMAFQLASSRGRAAAQTINEHMIAILSNEAQRKAVLPSLRALAGERKGKRPSDDLEEPNP